MYDIFKSIIFKIIPREFLLRHRFLIRAWMSVFYIGNKVYCPVEDKKYRKFITHKYIDHVELLSPRSGLLPRQRFLWLILDKLYGNVSAIKVLHFSPNAFFAAQLRQRRLFDYSTSDYLSNSFDLQLDITKIALTDALFDLIICYHVLEHIPKDSDAMKEIFRILKPSGTVLFQVPFTNDKATLEDSSINTPELRLKHYWQEDHVRLYSKIDFIDRLQAVGFCVEVIGPKDWYSFDKINYYGLNPSEQVFVARKSKFSIDAQ